MTREETKKAIEIMQAYVDGKPIECKIKGASNWRTIGEAVFNFERFDYRIKPGPKYRPFKSAGELEEAMEKHGEWVISNNTRNRLRINGYCEETVLITEWRNYDISFGCYTFADGTPFGKLEE